MSVAPNQSGAFDTWIGRQEVSDDVITPELVRRFCATLGLSAGIEIGGAAPALIHWCLAQPAVMSNGLGEDGHPKKGGFLPPIDLPRRMWAGGDVTFHQPLKVGDVVTRTSTVADIAEKSGRSGRLCFVTVHHVISANGNPAISEAQNIVYKEAVTASPPAVVEAPVGAIRETLNADPVLLFRYSALTFNGHRIHYDRPYAIETEHYSGLVVHGPLQATLLYNLAMHGHGAAPKRLSYRGLSPLRDGPVHLNATATENGSWLLWTSAPHGPIAMQAEAFWS